MFEDVIAVASFSRIALYGTPFCTSAKKAFFLIMRHSLSDRSFEPTGMLCASVWWRFWEVSCLEMSTSSSVRTGMIHVIGIMFIAPCLGRLFGYEILNGEVAVTAILGYFILSVLLPRVEATTISDMWCQGLHPLMAPAVPMLIYLMLGHFGQSL